MSLQVRIRDSTRLPIEGVTRLRHLSWCSLKLAHRSDRDSCIEGRMFDHIFRSVSRDGRSMKRHISYVSDERIIVTEDLLRQARLWAASPLGF
jgi:hypothetical protein